MNILVSLIFALVPISTQKVVRADSVVLKEPLQIVTTSLQGRSYIFTQRERGSLEQRDFSLRMIKAIQVPKDAELCGATGEGYPALSYGTRNQHIGYIRNDKFVEWKTSFASDGWIVSKGLRLAIKGSNLIELRKTNIQAPISKLGFRDIVCPASRSQIYVLRPGGQGTALESYRKTVYGWRLTTKVSIRDRNGAPLICVTPGSRSAVLTGRGIICTVAMAHPGAQELSNIKELDLMPERRSSQGYTKVATGVVLINVDSGVTDIRRLISSHVGNGNGTPGEEQSIDPEPGDRQRLAVIESTGLVVATVFEKTIVLNSFFGLPKT